ncbi:hypothetical protein EV182_005579, partial [Spiromyces aspiralis]
RMDKVTLTTIPWIRTINNNVFGDILYWFTQHHGTKLIEIVTNKLNEAYAEFMAEHPDFCGKIYLVCHSLGGLICYDILYLQRRFAQLRTREAGEDTGPELPPLVDRVENPATQTLNFEPSCLFTMGTPLGGTMVFRNMSFDQFTIPCRYHNIFQPYDPFGYRTEPLANEAYIGKPAASVFGLPNNKSVGKGTLYTLSKPVAASTSQPAILPETTNTSFTLDSARKSLERTIGSLSNLAPSKPNIMRQQHRSESATSLTAFSLSQASQQSPNSPPHNQKHHHHHHHRHHHGRLNSWRRDLTKSFQDSGSARHTNDDSADQRPRELPPSPMVKSRGAVSEDIRRSEFGLGVQSHKGFGSLERIKHIFSSNSHDAEKSSRRSISFRGLSRVSFSNERPDDLLPSTQSSWSASIKRRLSLVPTKLTTATTEHKRGSCFRVISVKKADAEFEGMGITDRDVEKSGGVGNSVAFNKA